MAVWKPERVPWGQRALRMEFVTEDPLQLWTDDEGIRGLGILVLRIVLVQVPPRRTDTATCYLHGVLDRYY
jgi:hypothetical protein